MEIFWRNGEEGNEEINDGDGVWRYRYRIWIII